MKYDLIVQGPLDNNRLNIIYSKVNFEFVGKVIYSDCTGNIDLALPNLIVINHIDPGENKPRYSKPLNIDRYLVGVRSSLNAVEQKYVLIIRSDINLSFDKITPLLNLDMLNVLDVTTKKFWLKDKWKFHFCDWLYFCEYEKIFNMINSTNYNDLPCTFLDSLFPCSPEYLLTYNYLESNGLINKNILESINVIYSKDIDLTCSKKGYEVIPFGVNKVYGLTKDDIYEGEIRASRKSKIYQFYLKLANKICK